ncbi:alcohol dehydrogenase family protein [Roseobacter sp. YSTF-M11]|uniref:Alcohol dehydrogenase family protein n=1 Tax=Roseobacter insulae TaxID=2859783 RepID=A0A9X1FXX8_9RHOB|nr:alcohol dehydrogenase family protein [Roseobacter insulae]MBW4708953.1 alcohol dehydrogenase family protein [Roseobacter insulae]
MTIPETMNAFVLKQHGGPEALEFHTDWPTPRPSPDQVLIKVGACGLNNTDVNTRSGWYSKSVTAATTNAAQPDVGEDDPSWGGAPISFPRIQGADVVGEVVAVGGRADPALMGKRVMVDCWLRDWDDPLNRNKTGYFGSECDGGFAEYTVVDHRNARVVDSPLSDAELATFPCSYSTAEGMLCRAQVEKDDTVLVTGASGGVGSALVQLATRRGARVVCLASEAKHADVARLNPVALLPRAPAHLKKALNAAIGRDTVSVVADIVGGDYFETLIDVLERGGRYTCSGAIAGPMVVLDLRTLYLRDLTFTGSTVLPPHVFGGLVSYIEQGEVKPMLAKTFPLEELHAAQAAFVAKEHTGNIVVVPGTAHP